MGMGGPIAPPQPPPVQMPAPPSAPNWPGLTNDQTLAAGAGTASDLPTLRAEMPTAEANNKIDHPGRLILRADNGDVLKEYPLEKPEMAIGRAPNSDILLSKDKLTSRRHATVHYENGHYLLRDERSANGTFVNGQQLEEMVPRMLSEGDKVGVGEHELLFHAFTSIENEKTIAVSFAAAVPVASGNMSDATISTRTDENATATGAVPAGDELQTRSMANGMTPSLAASAPLPVTPSPLPEVVQPQPLASPSLVSESSPPVPDHATMRRVSAPVPPPPDEAPVTIQRFTSLPQPSLPDVAPLMAALASLDGQVKTMQDQLNVTQGAMDKHESDIASTTNQLRTGMRRVSDRMDSTIADVARSREALAWADLLQLMEDVMNNPRDIEYVTKLARKARELNKVFQIHQNVLNTLAECNSLLRSLIGEDKQ